MVSGIFFKIMLERARGQGIDGHTGHKLVIDEAGDEYQGFMRLFFIKNSKNKTIRLGS